MVLTPKNMKPSYKAQRQAEMEYKVGQAQRGMQLRESMRPELDYRKEGDPKYWNKNTLPAKGKKK
jgi:hypothetical protein